MSIHYLRNNFNPEPSESITLVLDVKEATDVWISFSFLQGHNIKCWAINFEKVLEIDGFEGRDKWKENRVEMG